MKLVFRTIFHRFAGRHTASMLQRRTLAPGIQATRCQICWRNLWMVGDGPWTRQRPALPPPSDA